MDEAEAQVDTSFIAYQPPPLQADYLAEMQSIAMPSLSSMELDDFRITGAEVWLNCRTIRADRKAHRKLFEGYHKHRRQEKPQGFHPSRHSLQGGKSEAEGSRQARLSSNTDRVRCGSADCRCCQVRQATASYRRNILMLAVWQGSEGSRREGRSCEAVRQALQARRTRAQGFDACCPFNVDHRPIADNFLPEDNFCDWSRDARPHTEADRSR